MCFRVVVSAVCANISMQGLGCMLVGVTTQLFNAPCSGQ